MCQGSVGGKCNAGWQPLKIKSKPGYREGREIWTNRNEVQSTSTILGKKGWVGWMDEWVSE
ncbi:predicted protein [Sclerotinia sclerotiorum 1980 UF-70]|uniref:Uncharacterized protein n=1 Tax=Sclerotinia sclerotiorum (strain ATCC 18683 / 1980 / Ss-1) TaxID=665079 RepID=A7E9F1_SCLS1|nr:predicted protein [Sclerotinia sclerotiorum 1980 UF-70]EDN97003.1 predicted protein [Sclerotinia sclerotiorum 1980 UF-70]